MLSNETYLSVSKPLTISRKEFKDGLRDLINQSLLPAFVIGDALRDVINEVNKFEEEQFRMDLEAYNKSLMEEKMRQQEESKEGE